MNHIADAQSEVYKEEARELLVVLEDSLLQLERSPDDKELVGQIFRALHTIKGSGSMFGFDRIAAFTHEVETTFDLVRNSEVPVSKMAWSAPRFNKSCPATMPHPVGDQLAIEPFCGVRVLISAIAS